jgi:HK97 family phage portal protein
MAADRYAANHFSKGAAPSGALQVPSMPAEVSQEVVDRLRTEFMNRHSGTDNAGKPMVLTGGTTWNQISLSPEASQLLETRKFERAEIASIYRVPPFMIGDVERSTSWGTGIEQQGIGFVTYTLRPWLIRVERADSALLPRPQYVQKNVDALIRGDLKSRYEVYTMGRNAGILSQNEIREKEDLPPIPDGDTYLTPLNMSTGGPVDGPVIAS